MATDQAEPIDFSEAEADPFESVGIDAQLEELFEGSESDDDTEPSEVPAAEGDEPAAEGDEEKEDAGEKSEPQPKAEILTAPASFTAEEKADFEGLTDVQKKAAIRLEEARRSHFTQSTESVGKMRRRYEEIAQVVDPLEADFVEAGISPAQFIRNYLAIDKLLSENATKGLAVLARRLGVDPRQPLELSDGAGVPSSNSSDRVVLQRLEALENATKAKQEAEFNSEFQAAELSAARFRDEKDAQGNLVRPFLELSQDGTPRYPNFVGRLMTELRILAQQQPKLNAEQLMLQAYETTALIDPDARKAAEAARAAADIQKTREATNAAKKRSIAVGSSKGSAPTVQVSTLDSELDDWAASVEF